MRILLNLLDFFFFTLFTVFDKRAMDGWADGWSDGRAGGQTDRPNNQNASISCVRVGRGIDAVKIAFWGKISTL